MALVIVYSVLRFIFATSTFQLLKIFQPLSWLLLCSGFLLQVFNLLLQFGLGLVNCNLLIQGIAFFGSCLLISVDAGSPNIAYANFLIEN